MIEVFYLYKNKLGLWTYESKHFNNVKKATRFCYMIKHKPNMILDGYASYSSSDLEYMDTHINIMISERRTSH